jgi:hypothetical protein
MWRAYTGSKLIYHPDLTREFRLVKTTGTGKDRTMAQWAYKVAYIDYRGRISVEGVETLIGANERRSAFARRYLNSLGEGGWELVGIQPLTGNSAYYIFKRPAQEGDFQAEAPAATEKEAPAPQPATQGGGPAVETA